jgi:PH domain
LRVQVENVVKQGILYQRTALLKRFKKAYIFYLEKKDDITGEGPLLKYGKKGKPINHVMDLSQRPVEQTEG